MNSGHQANGLESGHQVNGINSGYQPNGINSGHQPNYINPQRQQNGTTSGHQPNGINPQRQQNGVIYTTRHTPNGTSSQSEREETDLEHQQSQSAPRDRAPMPLQPDTVMEDDHPVTAIQVPAAMDERPHYVDLNLRHCILPGCRCRFPDLRSFFGEHQTWGIDYQMFRALWEPPGMESLHGTYILFTIKTQIVDRRVQLQCNCRFQAKFWGDVFILKVKESIDGRAAFTDPLGYPVRTLPHQSGVIDARYENIEHGFLGSDLFEEMALAATPPILRSSNPASIQFAIPVGFWRAVVQGRVRTIDYQVPPVSPVMGLIIARFWPRHGGSLPPWMVPAVLPYH